MLMDRLAVRFKKKFSSRGSALICEVPLAGTEVLLAKPITYMNLSGQAIRELVERYRISVSDIVIAYDDVALPLGKIRVRPSGSSGGHKGIQSVMDCLGTRDVARLRIGIAGDAQLGDLTKYVLSRFRRKERELLEETLEHCVTVVEELVSDGIEQTMARFN
jgi:PTH1 family peptidyl-tRNA hydrolase